MGARHQAGFFYLNILVPSMSALSVTFFIRL